MPRAKPQVVVFFWNGIGDNWLNIPTYRALVRVFDGCVTFVMPAIFWAVLPEDIRVGSKFRELPSAWLRFQAPPQAELDSFVEDIHCDVYVSMNPYFSRLSESLKKSLMPCLALEFASEAGHGKVRYRHDVHTADAVFDLAQYFQDDLCIDEFSNVSMNLVERFESKASSFYSKVQSGYRVLCVHTHTRDGKKRWPEEDFWTTLGSFFEERQNYIGVIVDPDQSMRRKGRRDLPVLFSGELDLGSVAAIVKSSDLVLAIDSCFRHLADLSRTPVLGLFKSTSASKWGLRFGPGKDITYAKDSKARQQMVIEGLVDLSASIDQ